MLIYANRFHGCCHITWLSGDTGEIFLLLLLSRKQPEEPECSTQPPCCVMPSVRNGFAENSGKGGGEGLAHATCPLRERREKSVRDRVWIYSGFIATYYFHGGTSVNGVLVPPGGASGSRILPLAHKPVKLFG